ncbi:MAG TPA: hypothetical protein VMV10_02810 [Pirellulales bacterium]|nr:hypothetical protein [Pirellulales bacterium]
MPRLSLTLPLVAVVLALASLSAAEPESKAPAAKIPAPAKGPDQAALEKEFQESMSGATLVGYFTTNGQKDGKSLAAEKYRLKTVKKLQGDYWLFEYQYGDQGKTIPLSLEVKWAGDTPVITLTDLTIPGVGTFTARVLFYRGEYAGTWSGGDHGGKLFGKIVKEAAESEK